VRSLALIAAVFAVSGCQGNYHAKVGEILLAQSDSTIDAEAGETIEWTGDPIETLPEAQVIRLAIDRDVSWYQVRSLIARIEAEKKKPVLLVGRRLKVRAFDLGRAPAGEAIEIMAVSDGKACVSLPGELKAKCVQTVDKNHISRAFVRELVREAVKVSGLTKVAVDISPSVTWADVVRTIDGARTCCKAVEMQIHLVPAPEYESE